MAEKTLAIVYGDESSEELLVSSVAPNLYRLEESSLLGEGVFGDVIEAEMGPDKRLKFKRVASASKMNTVSFILTPEQINAPVLQALTDRVMSLGGNWARVFGGICLCICRSPWMLTSRRKSELWPPHARPFWWFNARSANY